MNELIELFDKEYNEEKAKALPQQERAPEANVFHQCNIDMKVLQLLASKTMAHVMAALDFVEKAVKANPKLCDLGLATVSVVG